ncbi:MAG TPA: hypothetical protein PK177_08390 [Burkholderiaceae bacterium]|nr:hypothetical protein [Burkholderiaceae bacterium]
MPDRRTFLAVAAATGLGPVAEANSQDWLGIHLETQREENLRRHQQGQASGSQEGTSNRYEPPISGKARHAAMRRHHREYSKILEKHGYRAADQWLAEQVAAGR